MGVLHRNLIPEEVWYSVRKDIFRTKSILQASPDYIYDKSSAVNSHFTGRNLTVPCGLVSHLAAETYVQRAPASQSHQWPHPAGPVLSPWMSPLGVWGAWGTDAETWPMWRLVDAQAEQASRGLMLKALPG